MRRHAQACEQYAIDGSGCGEQRRGYAGARVEGGGTWSRRRRRIVWVPPGGSGLLC
jgi:hypothetical protein